MTVLVEKMSTLCCNIVCIVKKSTGPKCYPKIDIHLPFLLAVPPVSHRLCGIPDPLVENVILDSDNF